MDQERFHISISQWAEDDRPREKLIRKGKSALSDAEIIAILLGSGTKTMSAVDLAKQILNHVNNDLNNLAKLSVAELTKFKGIGEAKAISIVSALELGRRRKETRPDILEKLVSAEMVYKFMKSDLVDLQHEEFWVILLRRNNTVIKKSQISIGGIHGTIADPKIIFKLALENNATNLIMVHNHPSGNLKPSPMDIQLTKKMKEAGRLLDIVINDHIIFTDHDYYSFSEESMM